jgi:hypothetical protein
VEGYVDDFSKLLNVATSVITNLDAARSAP